MATKEFESVRCVGNQNPSVSQSSQIIKVLYSTEITDDMTCIHSIIQLQETQRWKKGSKTGFAVDLGKYDDQL
ncbi:MAG: hypothetical protein EZS28_013823 [Streblomastix strix]|uniref:Uncharacterized protein n=1 Tax=Streblomastix strix TaxID=222440 RepID=A0A5J4W6T7_9EUKA|nr:MAG: hypothetical protein EZS28_013823 [Streblomastix strix]